MLWDSSRHVWLGLAVIVVRNGESVRVFLLFVMLGLMSHHIYNAEFEAMPRGLARRADSRLTADLIVVEDSLRWRK